MDVVYISELCRLLILIVLVSSAYTKTTDIGSFATSLADDFYVPVAYSRPVALAVAGLEWLAFFSVLSGGSWGRVGAILAVVLFVVFSAVMLEAILKRRRVFCNCFGRTKHPVSSLDLLRNTLYVAASGFYVLNAPYEIPGGLLAQLSLILAAALCFLLSSSMHEIKNLLR